MAYSRFITSIISVCELYIWMYYICGTKNELELIIHFLLVNFIAVTQDHNSNSKCTLCQYSTVRNGFGGRIGVSWGKSQF